MYEETGNHLKTVFQKEKAKPKIEEAKDFINKAREAGIEPSISGDWVVYEPSLPVEMILTASRLAEDVWRVLDLED